MRTIKVFLPIVFGILFTIALIVGFTHASEVTAATNNGDIIYVDADAPGPTHDGSSWDNAYTDLQDALANSESGDDIWVAEGVYTPGVTVSDTFTLTAGVAIYGGFAATETLRAQRNWETNITVLSGDIDKNDTKDEHGVVLTTTHITGNNAYHVVSSSSVTESAVLDGFTITAGNANENLFDGNGGGLYNNESSPKLTNITFCGNLAGGGGGMYNIRSNPILITVTFYSNTADNGGGISNRESSPNLTNVIIINNSANFSGGGWYNDISDGSLTNVIFSGNVSGERGGGMTNRRISSPELNNVTFSGNSAGTNGGGMFNDNSGSNPTLTNVTLAGNSANLGGGIYSEDYSHPTLINTILWGNIATTKTDSQIYNNPLSTTTISYSDIQDSGGSLSWNTSLGTDGGGNIDADPLFVSDPDAGGDGWGDDNDDYGDLHLLSSSPSIDTGTNWGCPTTDLDGNPRPVNVLCDMGAYEFQNSPPNAVDDGGLYFSTKNDTPFLTNSVLINDTDPDGDILQIDSFDSCGTTGLVTHLGYGVFSYDPNDQFDHLATDEQATDTFTYTANDGTDTATVTITIMGKSLDCQCVFLPEVAKED